MLKYIISLFFLFTFSFLFSQEIKKQPLATDIPGGNKEKIHLKPFNLRIGFDLGNYIYGRTQNLNKFNFYVDTNLYKQYFVNIEMGKEEYLFDNQLLNMSTKGTYYMLGLDYNLYNNWPGMDNQIMLGLHYGHATFTNHLQSYIINQSGNPFPNEVVVINKDFSGLKANWVEVQSIMQVEVLKNIYLGYNISFKYLLSKKTYEDFELTYIPGFRKVNSTSHFGFGIQYFISYRFHIKKAPK